MKLGNRCGFTLIELLVVVAVIGILAAITMPGLMNKTVQAKINSAGHNAESVSNTTHTWLQQEIIEKDKTYPEGLHSKGDGTDVSNGVQTHLGSNFKGNWAVYINSDGSLYALWAKDSSVDLTAVGQLTDAQLKQKKGKIGCYPIK